MVYAWASIVDPRLGNGRGEVPSPVRVKVYWLDINYLMLWSILHGDLTSKSIGNPQGLQSEAGPCGPKRKHTIQISIGLFCNFLLMNIHVYMIWL